MKRFFPALNKYPNYIFCNNAGGTQIPEQVLTNIYNCLINNYVQPGANNLLSKIHSNQINKAKNIVDIIFNNKYGTIVYGGSCSQLIYNLANSMENYIKIKKGNIILTDFNHESCITPFERIAKKNNITLKYWSLNNEDSNNKYKIDYNDLLEKVNENTSLVVLPHVSNVLGNILDIYYLNKKIKKINPDTKVLVDGVAYMPHGLVDVENFGCDFYVASFYKFCGLRISALYIKDEDFIYNIENQNHYFFDNSVDVSKKLEIGGINYENMSSINGVADYLVSIARFFDYNNSKSINSNLEFDRKLLIFVMEKIKIYESVFINMFKNFFNKEDTIKNIEVLECKETPKVPIFSLLFKDYNENNVNLILNELGLLCSNSTFYCDRLFDNLALDKARGTLRISLMHYNAFDEGNNIIEYLRLFKKTDLDFYYRLDSKYKNAVTKCLKNSFINLSLDKHYDNKRLRGYSLLKVSNIQDIQIIGDINFYQSQKFNTYNGDNIRKYDNIDITLLKDDCFKFLVNSFVETINTYNPLELVKYIQVHQIRVYAENEKTNLVPEGIHQDGYNIVGIACIARKNIKGGINLVYDSSKKLINNLQLAEGEMLILNDNKLYHDVLPIELYKEHDEGYRDILVFTTIS